MPASVCLPAIWVVLRVAFVGPATVAEAEATPVQPNAGYSAGDAKRDVATIMVDTTDAYTQARSRLMATPAVAAPALLARLEAVPAPGPGPRKRILDVLAALRRPEHLELFARELRRAVGGAYTDKEKLDAAKFWRPLIVDQAQAATATLRDLVGDRELPADVRALFLGDLVALTTTARIGELVAAVGRGDPELERGLRAALLERAERTPDERAALIAAADARIESNLNPGIVRLRADLAPGRDGKYTAQLATWATDDGAPFAVRVAALRVLASRNRESAARNALLIIANTHTAPPRRDAQRSEILGWLALRGLPPAEAKRVAAVHGLLDVDTPRLASVAYEVSDLPKGWLARSQHHPWPRVRAVALGRVVPPCDEDAMRRVSTIASPAQKRGDEEDVVARAAIFALGRCGANDHLRRLLANRKAGVHRRGDAAVALVKHGTARDVDAVAALLRSHPERKLGRRLVSALEFAEPEPNVRAALCSARDQDPEVARNAERALRALYPDEDRPCD